MTNEHAWIINTGSIRGFEHSGRPGILGYCAAKAGVHSATRTIAAQLAPRIFVNAVAPGFVHTGYIDQMNSDVVAAWEEDIPIGRLITPDEIAEVYLLLATSSAFTGSVVSPDGGYALLAR